jgi:hypothetical protein
MCNCISYNLPKDSQTVGEVVLEAPEWSSKENGVCVDACISKAIKAVWEAGYVTLNSCCGHNEEIPSIIVGEDMTLRDIADIRIIFEFETNEAVKILQWKLTEV